MKRAVVATLAVLGVLFVARSAEAFCRSTTCSAKKEECVKDENECVTTGAPLTWGKSTLSYRFHDHGSSQLLHEEARAAVRAAFHRWSDTRCSDGRRTSLRFVEGEDITTEKPLGRGTQAPEPFGIFFRDLGWPYQEDDEALAKTNTSYERSTGRIRYSDIEVNTTRRFSVTETSNEIDLQAVLTHEVGHFIGLGHSAEAQSIMASRYCDLGDGRCDKGRVAARRLAPDDVAAVCALFPPEEIVATEDPKAERNEGVSCRASGNTSPASGVLGIVSLVSLVARRRLRSAKPA